MTHLELRDKFLAFWKARGHAVIPSAPLVPENDPTTLFTGSGMQPMIPYLLGAKHPLGTRIADIQKCFRGQDIDEVGDNSHDTFFEMMGNWSLGDYFKKDQLAWYFEFLTKTLGFDTEKLFITCFEGYKNIPKDTESAEIWKALGIAPDHIRFCGVDDNWWSRSGAPDQMPAGEIGGPDSEVFYKFDNGELMEIGNSVFITYQKQEDGIFKELPQKNVDFGGGLERTLAALDNDPDIFKTDVYAPIIEILEKLSGKKYDNTRGFRIIADHLKASVFLISAGVTPSNKDRGYILRRLIRRAIRFGAGETGPAAERIIGIYKDVYSELAENRETIYRVLADEEKKFRRTFEQGLKLIGAISPFDLYQSYGFPPEVTEEIYNERGLKFDKQALEEELKKHRELSRSAGQQKFKGGLADHSETVTKYHTATHLLHAALRQILGEGVHQEGSNLTAERLRFDFSYPQKLSSDQLTAVENLVNEQIEKGLEQKKEVMTYDEAIKSGALAFFKERYPEKVTVYSFVDPSTRSARSGPPFSREICGGPHVENTKVLGKFKIIKEESVSAGVRRIYGQIY